MPGNQARSQRPNPRRINEESTAMKRLLRQFVFGTAAFAAGAAMADVTFFETDNFGGRQFTIDQPVANFARSRLNDRAQSAIVDGGAWEICVDA
ncbi:MAG TPA: beta/gamma crystallin-related protein, partial [Anaerolineae bacterium]